MTMGSSIGQKEDSRFLRNCVARMAGFIGEKAPGQASEGRISFK